MLNRSSPSLFNKAIKLIRRQIGIEKMPKIKRIKRSLMKQPLPSKQSFFTLVSISSVSSQVKLKIPTIKTVKSE